MDKQEFIDELYDAGWTCPNDAQHERIDTLINRVQATQAEIDRLKSDFIRLHTMAFKWVDKDHHDWQELMKLRWGE